MIPSAYEGMSAAVTAAHAAVPPFVKIQRLIAEAKTKREQAIRSYETDMQLPTLLDDIKKTDEEAQRRQQVIGGFIQQLSTPPPMMPTQTNLTLGEGIAGALGALFGDPSRAASAVSEAAQKRQAIQHQNALNAFGQQQQGARLNLDEAQRAQELALRLREQKQGRVYDAQDQLRGMKFKSEMDAVEAETGAKAKLIADAQDAVQAREMAKFKLALQHDDQAWELTKMNRQAELDTAKAKAVNLTKQQSDMVDAMIKGLEQNTDPEKVDAVLDELESKGIVFSEGMRLLYQERAKHNKTVEGFQASTVALAQRNAAQRVEQDDFNNTMKGLEFTQKGGTLPPAIAGQLGIEPMTPKPNFGSGEGKSVQLRVKLGTVDSELAVPEFFTARPKFEGDAKLSDLLETTQTYLRMKEQGTTLKPPTKTGNALADQANLRDYEKSKKEADDKLAELTGKIQALRMDVNSKATPEFKQWREGVRKFVLQQIKTAEDSKFASKKFVQENWRKLYQVLTGDDKP